MPKRLTTEEFIAKAKLIHNKKYNYKNVNYKISSQKVNIICQMHGIFNQSPNDHLNGKGCPKCVTNTKLTNDEFINNAIKIHGNEYDYSSSTYKGAHVKLFIKCKRHGLFTQTARNHLNGQKCPICTYRISKKEIKFLDILNVLTKNRQQRICGYNVDGYDTSTNTIYEFLGDYWHGNPDRFDPNNINPHCKKSFGKLYDDTMNKFYTLKSNGYNVKYIWELEWNEWNKNGRIIQIPITEFHPI